MWQEIFHIPRQKRRQFIDVSDREGLLPLAPDVDRPLDPNVGNTASIPARYRVQCNLLTVLFIQYNINIYIYIYIIFQFFIYMYIQSVYLYRFANILHSVHSCGEYDRLMQGVFENYPTIKFKDSYLNAVCKNLP